MSKVKEIISNQSVTINTGNFENQKINYGEVWEIEPGDNLDDKQKELCNHVYKVVNTLANHVRKSNKIKEVMFEKVKAPKVRTPFIECELEDLEREQRTAHLKPNY
jgi:hypothetical protein